MSSSTKPEHTPPKVAVIATVDMSLRYMLLNQMLFLRQAGYAVCGISAPGPETAAVTQAGIPYHPAALTRSFSPLADLRALGQIYRILRRERPTIVHTHTPKAGLLGQLAARLAGVPVVLNTVHGFYFHERTPPLQRRFYIALESVAARCSDTIFSQNREDIATAVREQIAPAARLKYLGNGFDLEAFDRAPLGPAVLAEKRRELGLAPGAPVVGFVGRLVAEKGILELLAAGQAVRQRFPEVRFLIVGPIDPDKPDSLSPAVARDYNLADACIFTGRRADMPQLYALMDVLVLPSHREGFPRTPMEASLMGVPSVVTDVRGCREAVEHERNGLVVPFGDVDALAAAIGQVLADPALARRLGAAGRQMARERFDERRVFQAVCDEYARLLAARGIPAPGASPEQRVRAQPEPAGEAGG
ncbi:MAG TPA: glycosyltransferase family 4 protein [Anaerolineaceae bacterium]|nr:glycosyltransferase family 4 protein [Anaerolineaceae bacterium]